MRKTKIVCTIGPASESVEKLEQLIDAGMNVARLNFSHGDHAEHKIRIDRINEAARKKGKVVGILLDTRGPEIRTHSMQEGRIELVAGNQIDISMVEVEGTTKVFSVTYDNLLNDIEMGSMILLDDGLIRLEVIGINHEAGLIHTMIINSGVLKNKKGVNIPGIEIQLPGLTEKDEKDIIFGIEEGVDFIAASFVRRASDVIAIRSILEGNGGAGLQIIPKIENQEGIDNIDEILEISDGLMVARGDLGVEIPSEEVPLIQKTLIKKCNQAGKPVITATQMLDSMEHSPRPTRAEASDVANAILDGSDAIMLSGETAAGMYPVESVIMMDKIAVHTEISVDYRSVVSTRRREKEGNMTEAIGQAAAYTALNLNVKAVLAPTRSGQTAKMIAKYRPGCPIIALTSSEKASKKLSLVWGVYPIVGSNTSTIEEILEESVEESVKHQYVSHGDVVIITAGVPVGKVGTTNLMKIHVIGDLLARGQGIGKRVSFGKAVVAHSVEEAEVYDGEGSILVTHSTDKDMIPFIEKCAGIITEEGGLTSHAAVVGLSLGIPVIVGVEDATKKITHGNDITMDAETGVVYNGHASVLG